MVHVTDDADDFSHASSLKHSLHLLADGVFAGKILAR